MCIRDSYWHRERRTIDTTWDTHSRNFYELKDRLMPSVDRPIAALLEDLENAGLLEETLVVWNSEFGRTPMAQGSGRDHHMKGFSFWLAGGGIMPGNFVGETDECGFGAIDQECLGHDLHATVMHLLGLDHKRLTFRFQGRDFRLTDVHGNVIHDALV